MEKILTREIVEDVLLSGINPVKNFVNCSFITTDGKFLPISEHYEVYKYLVVQQLVQCIPDAEHLIDELGYIRYSYIGYVTLAPVEPTKEQYKTLEYVLYELQHFRRIVSIQVATEPSFYVDVDLEDNIENIMNKIKKYYKTKKLKTLEELKNV